MTKEELIKRADGRAPALRSCWECNPAHDHLNQEDDILYLCFVCNRYYMDGIFLTENRWGEWPENDRPDI